MIIFRIMLELLAHLLLNSVIAWLMWEKYSFKRHFIAVVLLTLAFKIIFM